MAVDTSGEWWKGTGPDDVRAFLEAYAAEGYAVHDFRLARCTCQSDVFRLEADDDEGTARRSCARCGEQRFICDSEEYWAHAAPEAWRCVECPSETTNIGVGFSFYEDGRGIRWLYIGVRCTDCGMLGCFTGWKVGHDDMSLLARV